MVKLKTPYLLQRFFRNRSLSFQLKVSTISVSILSAILVGVIWLTFETGKLRDEMENATDEYFNSKEQLGKNEVESAIDYIEYNKM